jgi:hypothetical protein
MTGKLFFLNIIVNFFLTFNILAEPTVCNKLDEKPFLFVDFESDQLSLVDGTKAYFPNASDAFEIVHNPVRNGKNSIKVKINNNDTYISAGAHRAEFATIQNKKTAYNEGDHFRYSFSFLLSENWEVDSRNSIDSIFQFKRVNFGPDMFIAIKGSDLVLRILNLRQEALIKNLKLGEWVDVCLDVVWSSANNGHIQGFVKYASENDYIRVFDIYGQNMINNGLNKTYLKWGLYKPGYSMSTSKLPRIIYFDDISITKE